MATPTVSAIGTAATLLLVTDREGVVDRVPLHSVCSIRDSSNDRVHRLDICHAKGQAVLLFDTAEELATVLGQIDALY